MSIVSIFILFATSTHTGPKIKEYHKIKIIASITLVGYRGSYKGQFLHQSPLSVITSVTPISYRISHSDSSARSVAVSVIRRRLTKLLYTANV